MKGQAMIKKYHIRLKKPQEGIVLPESFDDAEWDGDLGKWIFYREGTPSMMIEGDIVHWVETRVESYE